MKEFVVELVAPSQNQAASLHIAMPTAVLCGRVQNDIRTQLQRPLEDWSRERVVNKEERTDRMRGARRANNVR